jgi:hypothetical protein
MLSQVVDLACDATAAALHAGKMPQFALSLLEQGRDVLATSLEEMRTDVLDLQERPPELTRQFLSLLDELEPPIKRDSSMVDVDRRVSLQTRASRRSTAGHELDNLIVEIRKRLGFKNFLLPPSEEEMQAAARYGQLPS